MASYRSSNQAAESWGQARNHHHVHSASESMKDDKSSSKFSSAMSFWSRKSLKRSNTTHSTSPVVPPPVLSPATDAPPSLPVGSADDGKLFPNTFGAQLSYSRSFAPESTNFNDMLSVDDPLAAIPDPACKVKYHIHNPLGPRWYKNHHLIPPSQIKPSMRPPTFFSTSFPPISTSSMPENIGESANPSMGASNSPLPTPTSSETRVGEGIKPRSRKTSQTTPDNVDLLDVTDPWGTNWHHESPYDIGAPTSNKVEPEACNFIELGRRLRRASMTAAQNSFKAVTPSPLSQSTSAVHLHDLVPEKPPTPAANTISPSAIQLPRKLSKRKPTDLNGLFRPPTKDEERKAVSAPPTPVERICLTDSTHPEPGSLPKRMSVAPPVSYGYTPQISPTKKEKRGSVLGRIVKKFSLLRKSQDDFGKADSREYSWLHVNPDDARSPSMRPSVDLYNRQPSPEKQEPVKRVPAPSIAPQSTSPSSPEKEKDYSPPPPPSAPQEDRSSYISLDAPFSIGKLTIANPDTPSEKGSPVLQSIPLSPEPSPPTTRLATPEFKPLKPAPSPSPSPALHPPKIPARENSLSHAYDKPLPIPAPSTVASSIGGSSPLPESRQDLEPQLPNGSRPTRTGTVSSTATYKPGVPIPAQDTQPSADPDSDTDSSSSDSDSSSSDDEASSVSNKPIAPESTVEASTVSKAPTLPEKPPVVPTPPPPVSPPTPSPPPAASRDTTPKAKEGRTSRANSVQRLSKAPEIPPLSLSFANGSAAGVYPIAMSFTPEELTTQDRINSFLSGAESPYSATSVLANPPTPYHDRSALLPNPETPAVAPPPLPAKPPPKETTKRSSRDPSPGQPTRQTETFKLVRNHSGNAYMSTETIVAAGQQWEVVGTEKPKNRSSSKKDKDHHRENARKESGSSSRHNNNNGVKVEESDPYARSHQRHSKQVSSSSQQLEVSTVPMPSKTVNGKRSSSYRYEDGHEHRRYEEPQQIMSPRSGEDSSSSKYREDRRKSDYRRSKEEMRGSISKDDYRRIEEQRRREERRRYEEEKRYEEERQMEKERRRRERHEKERERELRERERELERERERLERERQLELEKEREREVERERERERERQRELARERELLEREREREREKERELEKERQREQKRREREMEKERQRELERQRIRELERELEKEREKAKEREEREKERQREKDRERRRREREERRQQEEKAKERSREENKRRSPDDSKHRRKRDDRKSEDERKDRATVYLTPEHSRVESYYSNGSQSMYIPQSSEGRVERRPSTATRPTSELPSTADLNALRAKEAWDMERMWKARSMYGTELNGNAVQAIPAQSVLSFSDNLSTQGATYGSSHTAFMLQTPFQAPGSSIYHSMPTKPPPIIYGSPASIPSLPDSLPYDPYDNNNIGPTPPRPIRKSGVGSSPPDALPAPTLLRRKPLVENPLPEPPRESTFQPSALGHLNPSTVNTGDYWSKYAGVTTAH